MCVIMWLVGCECVRVYVCDNVVDGVCECVRVYVGDNVTDGV